MPDANDFPVIAEPISQELIDAYADLSGDYNPLHVDQEMAAASEFGGTIAHGPMPLQAFFRSLCGWLGTEAPPEGTEVKVTYRAPTRPGDTISAELTESEEISGQTRVSAECKKQDGTTVISVTATVPA
jgi:3-hydroxybutyryl-CoA dehydratase